MDVKLLRSLYVTFVRPLLEFAIPVWSPIQKGDIDLLESVQHRATRIIPSLKKISYENRMKAFDLTTLSERRQRGDMIQLYKIYNGIDKLETSKTIAAQLIKREETKQKTQSKLIAKSFSSTVQLIYGTACQVKWSTQKQFTALKQVLIAG
jgi:hypothetical protein